MINKIDTLPSLIGEQPINYTILLKEKNKSQVKINQVNQMDQSKIKHQSRSNKICKASGIGR